MSNREQEIEHLEEMQARHADVLVTPGVEDDEEVIEALVEALGLMLVYIPPGPFTMGSDDSDAFDNEKPVHQVHLDGYWIGRYPVTNIQYKQFIDANPDHRVPYRTEGWARPYNWDQGQRTYPLDKADHPVVLVSWHEAIAYCRWMSTETGLNVRLPTEAEWEKAARGTDGRRYPWGDRFDETKCNTIESNIRSTTPVDKYPEGASPYGTLDMAGNVWEWCTSLSKKYPYRVDDGREDMEASGLRVLRGGSWLNDARLARCAYRHDGLPDGFYDFIGFRVCVVSRQD